MAAPEVQGSGAPHARGAPRRDEVVSPPAPGLTPVVERNIEALLLHRRAEREREGRQQRIADRVTRFTGSMLFVYIHLTLFGVWIVGNLGAIPAFPVFDPSFVVLAMFASVEAIFLSTFVLISQNRMAALADRRADLDLQVSLLTEHELTRLITLVKEVAVKLEVEHADETEIEELEQDVAPEKVLQQMESSARKLGVEGP